jgi:predicted DNA-binding antitoxin AbrB/MazE fold protein
MTEAVSYSIGKTFDATEALPMQSLDAIYDAGVFRPTGAVSLPDQCRVRITVEPLPEPETEAAADEALGAVYEVLSHRHRSGRSDLSARHDELQP